MAPAPASLRAKLMLLAGAVGFCLLLLVVAELACRALTDVRLLGTSRDLFSANMWGDSKGNAPGSSAVTFGSRVFIDRHGFRVPPDHDGAAPEVPGTEGAVLILGDSVAFGPGVREPETLAGLLRAGPPPRPVYNASVIGHDTFDYQNVVTRFISGHAEVKTVVLVFCLNDVSRASAGQIDASLGARTAAGFPRTGPIRWLNDRLRSRSVLYVMLKNSLTDPQRRYWEADFARYAAGIPVETALEPIAEIAGELAVREVDVLVVISPYEFQLRSGQAGLDEPQRRVTAFLDERGIPYLDALPGFRRDAGPSHEYFLPGDPMHLSERGHALVYRMIAKRLGS